MGEQGADDAVESMSPASVSAGQREESVETRDQGGMQHSETSLTGQVMHTLTIEYDAEKSVKILASPHETIAEIRQSLSDLQRTSALTCYHFEFAGQRLNDYAELQEIENLPEQANWKLVRDPYTERDARAHVARVRDIIGITLGRPATGTECCGIAAGTTNYSAVILSQGSEDELPHLSYQELTNTSLAYHVQENSEHVQCVKTLAVSPWNPPPPTLRAKGQLLYLVLCTVEGETFHITAHVRGFYVNRSSGHKFDPSARGGPPAHTLVELIARLSPHFSQRLEQYQAWTASRDPLLVSTLTNCLPASSWIVSTDHFENTPDPGRAQEPMLMASAETLRDWNEEIQSAREMPRSTVSERLLRERLLNKSLHDFTTACVTGAILVATGQVTPVNPLEPESAHMYIYNNIFFSRDQDGIGIFKDEGGDAAAHAAVARDLAGVRLVSRLDPPSVCTLGTTIVDYAGQRIVCQSVVPGIFRDHTDEENQIVYGGVEGRHTVVKSDPAFGDLVADLGRQLHLQPHTVVDDGGCAHELNLSVDAKGLSASDGRHYLLDLYRITPFDVCFNEKYGATYPHKITLLRPELVETFWEGKLQAHLREREANKQEDVEPESQADFNLALNPDAFITEQDEDALVREASRMITETQIPRFIDEVEGDVVNVALDGVTLARNLHKRGINMRYLGILNAEIDRRQNSKASGQLEALSYLVREEVVSRAAKHVARRIMQHLPLPLLPNAVSCFFNCLLNKSLAASVTIPSELQDIYPADAYALITSLEASSVREQVKHEAELRFNSAFDVLEWIDTCHPASLIRSLCLKLGVQLRCRDYATVFDLPLCEAKERKKGKKGARSTSPHNSLVMVLGPWTFAADDICDIVPVVKDCCPISVLASDSLDAGRITLAQGDTDLGLELMTESLSLHESIYGFTHPEVARAYTIMALTYYNRQDNERAVELARKSVIIFDRTVGVDAGETVLSYLNLGLFEYASGHVKEALRLVGHALRLWLRVSTTRVPHPELVTIVNNVAAMYQNAQDFDSSLAWYQAGLELARRVYGEKSISVANTSFQLAQAQALMQDSRASVNTMRDAYTIFKAEFGPEDRATKEAEALLGALTQNAVAIARRDRDALRRIGANGRVPAVKGAGGRVPHRPVGSTNGPTATSSTGEGNTGFGSRGEQTIDELVRYINGESNGKRK